MRKSVKSTTGRKKGGVDKRKTEYVFLVAHQLQVPLSSINWNVELLLGGDAGRLTKDQKSYLEEIHSESKRMGALIHALLNVSHIENETFKIDPVELNIIDVLRDVLDEQRNLVRKKKIKISSSFLKGTGTIISDRQLVYIIFQNLLSNAIKFTPTRGKVHLSLTRDKKKDHLRFTISDTGYGIPKKQQKKIFSKLFRADNIQKKGITGTGLGLYIVKAILDSIKGEISFTSVENEGTTFTVILPTKGIKKKDGDKQLLPSVF